MGGGPKRKVVSPSWLLGTLAVPYDPPLLFREGRRGARRRDAARRGGGARREGWRSLGAHLGLLQVLEKGELLRKQEEERATTAAGACRASDAVDVRLGLVGRVELHDPVDGGDVEATRGHVGAQQHTRRGRAKVEEGGRALVLLLVAMQVEHGQVDVVEEL